MAINLTPPARSQYSRKPTEFTPQPDRPVPTLIGLPEHYTDFRYGQWEYIDAIVRSDKPFTGLQLPVGSGKTVIETGAALLAPGRSAILTATKTLSDQLYEDMATTGMVDIRGLNNYVCMALIEGGEHASIADPDKPWTMSCEDGPCMFGMKCGLKFGGCTYFDKVSAALSSRIVSTNYSYFMHAKGAKNTIGRFDWLFCDEAHDAVEQVTKYLTVELGPYEVENFIGERWPGWAEIEPWREWAARQLPRIENKFRRKQEELQYAPNKYGLRELRVLRRLLSKLSRLAMAHNWIVFPISNDDDNGDYTPLGFAPLWPKQHTYNVLFEGSTRRVLASSTLTRKTMELLGIGDDDYDYYEAGSRFPIENRPVHWIKTCQISKDTSIANLAYWVSRIDQIIDHWPNHKGIIHTTSYRYRDFIIANSRHAARMVTHTSATTRQVIEAFKRDRGAPILVSPSVGTGHDFKDDYGRWQIITKIPIPDTSDPMMAARCADDRDYGMHIAAQKLQQMTGRIVRSETDWGVTYLVDDSITWFQRRYGQFLAFWWLDSLQGPHEVVPVIRR